MSRAFAFIRAYVNGVCTRHVEIVQMLRCLFAILLLSIAMSDASAGKPSNQPPMVSLSTVEGDAVFAAPGNITLVASALDADGTIASVAIYHGSILLKQVGGAGGASFNWTNVPIGTYTLTAVATDDDGASTTSSLLTVRVAANVAPSISITSPANNAEVTLPGTVALRVNTSDAVGRVVRVDYYRNGILLYATSAPWFFNWSNPAVGTYTLTAKATDDKGVSTTSDPVTLVVKENGGAENVAPTVAMTATPATSTAPGTIALSATASDNDGNIAKVEFFSGADLLAMVTQAPYSYTWSNVAAGTYSLTARATDNLGATSTTQPSVVTVASAGPQIYYVYADQINTAREITNAAGAVVWRGDVTEPFGAHMPNENPSNLGTFTFNPRFPGQYFDKETALHYNYYRDFDSFLGRYIQSDPIGLRGGVNTFTYVLNNPLSYADPFGLDVTVCFYSDAAMGFGHVGFGLPGESRTQGFYPSGNPFNSPGDVQTDMQKEQECKIIKAPPEKDRCMQRCRDRTDANPGNYSLTTRQCTSFVRDCLKECGLPTVDYTGPKPNPFFQKLPGN